MRDRIFGVGWPFSPEITAWKGITIFIKENLDEMFKA